MAFRQGMIRTAIALGVAFMLAAPLTASAQGGGRSRRTRRPRRRHSRPGRVRGGGQAGGGRAAVAAAVARHVHSRGRRPRPALGAL